MKLDKLPFKNFIKLDKLPFKKFINLDKLPFKKFIEILKFQLNHIDDMFFYCSTGLRRKEVGVPGGLTICPGLSSTGQQLAAAWSAVAPTTPMTVVDDRDLLLRASLEGQSYHESLFFSLPIPWSFLI